MSGFKKSQPGLAFSGEKITPDEMDRYEIYHIVNPGTTASWWEQRQLQELLIPKHSQW